MSRGNIFQIRKITNEQTINVNRWNLRFIGLTDKLLNKAPTSPLFGVRDRYEAVKNALGGDPATSLEISLVSSNFPAVGVEIGEIPRFNDRIKMATKFSDLGMLTVSFIDYVNGSASAILSLWQAFVADKRTGAIGFKQDFVLPKAEFYVYGPDAPGYNDEFCDANDGPPWLQKYEIVNLWPSKVTMPEHADSADVRKVSVDFVIDNIYPVGIRTYNYNATTPETRYTETPASALGSQAGW